MKLNTLFLVASILVFSPITELFATGIDDNCKQLTYRTAPIVNADLYICHTEYAIAYSYKSKNPIYTTELLVSSHIGKLPRTNDFRVDPAIPKQYQSSPKDFRKSGTACNGGRCDQGHMTPDQDFSSCDVCVHESFFMSNMVPQNYQNNEIIWRMMEMKIRNYALKHPSGVYIITGPVYQSDVTHKTLGANQVWIPDQLFKIAIDVQTGKSITFLIPNAPETNLPQFITNIAAIEKITGIIFDNSLDKNKVANFNDW
jgi:endonuclease G